MIHILHNSNRFMLLVAPLISCCLYEIKNSAPSRWENGSQATFTSQASCSTGDKLHDYINDATRLKQRLSIKYTDHVK